MKYLQTDNIPEDLSFHLKKFAKKVLRFEARQILKKYRPKIVAVTGSVGKTLTKEAIYTVLSKSHFVRKSEKSFTAEVGVPLAIIGCPQGTGTILQWVSNILFGFKVLLFRVPYPEYLILEIDNDKTGDLKKVSRIMCPDILVMTAIGDVPSHIESFPSLDDYISEQKDFVSCMKKDGVILYNSDDLTTLNILVNTETRSVSCGVHTGDLIGSDYKIDYEGTVPVGMSFDINMGVEKYTVSLAGSIGIQNEYAGLLAFALGLELKMDPKKVVSLLNKFSVPPARMRILEGIKNTIIIDDSYNSSPQGLAQALVALKKIKTKGRKIAVIGDMLELGKFSAEEHRKIAKDLKASAKYVITVGFRARKIYDELHTLGFDSDKLESHESHAMASISLENILNEKDVVLVKGSQAMRLEKVVESIMLNPKDKKRLLVRQGGDWAGR